MQERGILFTPENIAKVECSVKTQTRRVVKPPEHFTSRCADLALASPVPVWSTEDPTVPGWYWWYGGDDTETCIWYVEQEDIQRGKLGGSQRWVGPLHPPQEGGAG